MSKSIQDLVSEARNSITEIDSRNLRQQDLGKMHIIDVREPEEFALGHIDGAINIPRGVLEFKVAAHPELSNKSAPLLLYCKSGGRCALATQTLQHLGYTNVISLSDGIDGWNAGNPA